MKLSKYFKEIHIFIYLETLTKINIIKVVLYIKTKFPIYNIYYNYCKNDLKICSSKKIV